MLEDILKNIGILIQKDWFRLKITCIFGEQIMIEHLKKAHKFNVTHMCI